MQGPKSSDHRNQLIGMCYATHISRLRLSRLRLLRLRLLRFQLLWFQLACSFKG